MSEPWGPGPVNGDVAPAGAARAWGDQGKQSRRRTMSIGVNHTKRKLAANELVLAMAVNQMRTPTVAMIASACGFDAIYIDLEHNPTSLETAAGICVAALGVGITPIARVTRSEEHTS